MGAIRSLECYGGPLDGERIRADMEPVVEGGTGEYTPGEPALFTLADVPGSRPRKVKLPTDVMWVWQGK